MIDKTLAEKTLQLERSRQLKAFNDFVPKSKSIFNLKSNYDIWGQAHAPLYIPLDPANRKPDEWKRVKTLRAEKDPLVKGLGKS